MYDRLVNFIKSYTGHVLLNDIHFGYGGLYLRSKIRTDFEPHWFTPPTLLSSIAGILSPRSFFLSVSEADPERRLPRLPSVAFDRPGRIQPNVRRLDLPTPSPGVHVCAENRRACCESGS